MKAIPEAPKQPQRAGVLAEVKVPFLAATHLTPRGTLPLMTSREERAIIRKVLAGDRTAAEQLVRGHQASLYAYMLRMTGRPEVAEDVVQEAFVRAFKHLERYDNRFRFSTWLFTIARRLHVNAAQRLTPSFDSDFVSAATARNGEMNTPFRPMFSNESSGHARDAIEIGLEALSSDQREAVILFYQLDWPIDQISAYLDQPEGTIKSHLHRARARMKEAIQKSETALPRIRELLA